MANTLGSLVVKLGLDAAEFVSGLSKAEYEAKKFSDQASASFKKLGGVLAGLGISTAIGAFIKSTIESAAALDRMATSTGATVEELSRFAKVAKITGSGSIEDISAGLQRLTRSMQGADEQSKGAGVAFAALGIKTRDSAGNLRDSGAVMEEVAKTLDKYADGANKTAIAQALFGRAGAELLPFLKELAQNQEIVGKVTTEQAEAAKKLEKEWNKLTAAGGALGQMVLIELVPPITRLLELLNSFGGKGLFAFLGMTPEDEANPFKALDETVAKLGRLRAQRAELDPSKSLAHKINDILFDDIKNIDIQIGIAEARENALRQMVNSHYVNRAGPKDQAPAIPKVGADGSTKAAKQAVADYTDEIQRLNDQMMKASGADGGYTHLIAANEQFQKDLKAGKDINIDQVQTLMRTAQAADEQEISIKAVAAAWKEYEDQVKQAEAAEKRATESIGAFTERNDAFEKSIAIIGKGQKAYDLLNAELEHNKRLNEAIVSGKQVLVDIENQQYERQKNLIAAYHEANDVLQQQIEYNRIFTDSFADAVTGVVTGTKSIGDAFKDMEKQIVAAISRIAAQNIANAIFGVNPASGGGGIGALITAFLAGSGGPNFGSYATGPGMAQLGGPGGGLAGGTDYWRGGPTWVGERGPEIVNLPRGAQVIPFDRATGKGITISQQINVLPGASRASAAQAAAAAAREARVAAIRNG